MNPWVVMCLPEIMDIHYDDFVANSHRAVMFHKMDSTVEGVYSRKRKNQHIPIFVGLHLVATYTGCYIFTQVNFLIKFKWLVKIAILHFSKD